MVRSPRRDDTGAWFHVMNRGAARAPVFRGPDEARRFLAALGSLHRRFGVEVHAYCVMATHYHLLVRARPPDLIPAVGAVERAVVVPGAGPRLREAPRVVAVRAERHAVHVSRYIHANPVVAGLVTRAEDWPWSSYRGYLNPPEGPAWLHVRPVLARFGAIGAHERYRAYVEEGLAGSARDLHGGAPPAPVLGDEGLVERVRRGASLLGEDAVRDLPAVRSAMPRVPLSVIARNVSAAFGVPVEVLRVGARRPGPRAMLVRGAFVHAALRLGPWPLAAIAGWLGYASPAGPARAAARFSASAAADPGRLGPLREAAEATMRDLGLHDEDARAGSRPP